MCRDLDFEFPWDKTHDTLVMAAMLKPGNAPKDLLTLSMEELDYDGKQDLDVEDYVEENNLDTSGPRTFSAQDRKNKERSGSSITYTRHDKGISTEIGSGSMRNVSGKKTSISETA